VLIRNISCGLPIPIPSAATGSGVCIVNLRVLKIRSLLALAAAVTFRRGAPMNRTNRFRSQSPEDFFLRRQFLGQLAAIGTVASVWPALADTPEGWDDGDPLCRVPYTELAAPEGYELDAAFLKSFIGLSEALTGVKPLDQNMAGELMDRYARHKQLSPTLKKLVDTYRSIAPGDTQPSDAALKQSFFPDTPSSDDVKNLTEGAKQLIYLWYVSAFYLLIPDSNPPTKAWEYGTREQYRRALLWSVIQAHAPMTPGGRPGHWASAPTI
jgi:hypothetical protein